MEAAEGLVVVEDYADLLHQCAQMGFTHAEPSGAEIVNITGRVSTEAREAIVFELTFRSDGYYLLRGHELVDGSYGQLMDALRYFDPYDNNLIPPAEL